mgnify:CR=1 FL=1
MAVGRRRAAAVAVAAVVGLVAPSLLTSCSGSPADQINYAVDGMLITYNTNTVRGAASAGPQAFAGSIVAYEPVWAIGTGRTASPAQAQAVHAFIRGEIAARDATIAGSLPILYGGSVKPDNAASLFSQADVDGGLIGGASLVAEDFLAIIRAA